MNFNFPHWSNQIQNWINWIAFPFSIRISWLGHYLKNLTFGWMDARWVRCNDDMFNAFIGFNGKDDIYTIWIQHWWTKKIIRMQSKRSSRWKLLRRLPFVINLVSKFQIKLEISFIEYGNDWIGFFVWMRSHQVLPSDKLKWIDRKKKYERKEENIFPSSVFQCQ